MNSGYSRHWRRPYTTDDYPALDVRRWSREGMLKPGYRGGWQWTLGGEVVASIRMQAERDYVVLIYKHRIRGEDWKDEHYAVRIERTACNFGGARPWFICPAVGCGRRVAILYGGETFACRYCYRLAYASTREGVGSRATRRAGRIRERLRWPSGTLHGHGDKPKWMRWQTFNRLLAQHDHLAQRSWHAVAMKFDLSVNP